jgi:dTDP-4-dehydrorhamnose reductase
MKYVLILGSKGMLGGQLMKVFPEAMGWDRNDVDVLQFQNLKLKIENLKQRPKTIINCIAYNDVDGAEENQDKAFALNADFVGRLASFCREKNIILVHFSTNYVFDGKKGEYQESDKPQPLSKYGQSKYQGELNLQKNTDKFYLIRTSVLFGPKGESEASKQSFVDLMLQLSEKSATIKAVTDEVNNLTLATDLAQKVKYLLDANQPFGVYHITNSGQASWYDFSKEIFKIIGKDIDIISVSSSEFPRKAIRPKKSVLMNTKLPALRSWQEALKEFLNQRS